MTNIFKLPNGGALYLHTEIDSACKVILKAKRDYKIATEMATDYAETKWSWLPWYKRFCYRMQSGIFTPDIYCDWYKEKKLVELEEYKGSKIIQSVATPYITNTTIAAKEVLLLGSSKRNCYLNPDQIEVVELCNGFVEKCEK